MEKGFLASLQDRQKSKVPQRKFCVGDILILKVDTPSNDWKLAKVIEVCKDNKGCVQTVQLYLRCSDSAKLKSHVLVHPIDYIVLLVDST